MPRKSRQQASQEHERYQATQDSARPSEIENNASLPHSLQQYSSVLDDTRPSQYHETTQLKSTQSEYESMNSYSEDESSHFSRDDGDSKFNLVVPSELMKLNLDLDLNLNFDLVDTVSQTFDSSPLKKTGSAEGNLVVADSNTRDSTATITIGSRSNLANNSKSLDVDYFDNRFSNSQEEVPGPTSMTVNNNITRFSTTAPNHSIGNTNLTPSSFPSKFKRNASQKRTSDYSDPDASFLSLSSEQLFLPFVLNASQEMLMKEFNDDKSSEKAATNNSFSFRPSASLEFTNSPTSHITHEFSLRTNTVSSAPERQRVSQPHYFLSNDSETTVHPEKVNQASKHISQFYHLNVWMDNGETLSVTISKDATIEQLAKQIEAEHWFSTVLPKIGVKLEKLRDPMLQEGIKKGFQPFFVEHLYNKNMKPVNFGDKISDALVFGDTVYVVADPCSFINRGGRLPGTLKRKEPNIEQNNLHFGKLLSGSSSNGSLTSTTKETVDERFQNILKNTIALKLFHDFCMNNQCLQKLLFWLDVEIFKTCDDSLLSYYAEYLFNTYIKFDSPLRIDAAEFIKKTISSTNVIEIRKHRVYYDAQNLIYLELRDDVFTLFEKTSAYKTLMEQMRFDPDAYYAEDIIGTVAEHFMSEPNNVIPSIKGLITSSCTALDIFPIQAHEAPEDRQKFKKKVNKLQSLLGESLDQETRKKVLGRKEGALDHRKIDEYLSVGVGVEEEGSEVSAKLSFNDIRKKLGKFVHITSEADKADMTQLGALDTSSREDIKFISVDTPTTDSDIEEKLKTLTGEDKKSIQKRVSKLEQVFGQQPPTASLVIKNQTEHIEEEESEEELLEDDKPKRGRKQKLSKLTSVLGEKITPQTIAKEEETAKFIAQDSIQVNQIRGNKKLGHLLGLTPSGSVDKLDNSAANTLSHSSPNLFSRPISDQKANSENSLNQIIEKKKGIKGFSKKVNL